MSTKESIRSCVLLTAEGNAGRSNNAGLNNSILLASKRLFQVSRPMKHLGPCLDKEEPQKTSGDIERRYDSRREVKLHNNEAKQDA